MALGATPSRDAWKRISRTVRAYERSPHGSVGATRKKIFTTAGGGGDSGRWFRIASSTRDGANYRWTYTAKRTTKATAGYGGWADDTADTADYTLYNGVDDANGATGTFGNGVSSANLTGSFAPVPLAAGAKVHAMPVKVASTGETEWWIDRVGQIDGGCF